MSICDGRVERFRTPNLLADPKQKLGTLRSEERRLHTRSMRNIYNLFIFPSDFQPSQSLCFMLGA